MRRINRVGEQKRDWTDFETMAPVLFRANPMVASEIAPPDAVDPPLYAFKSLQAALPNAR